MQDLKNVLVLDYSLLALPMVWGMAWGLNPRRDAFAFLAGVALEDTMSCYKKSIFTR